MGKNMNRIAEGQRHDHRRDYGGDIIQRYIKNRKQPHGGPHAY